LGQSISREAGREPPDWIPGAMAPGQRQDSPGGAENGLETAGSDLEITESVLGTIESDLEGAGGGFDVSGIDLEVAGHSPYLDGKVS
jgi:hypothetical protein